MSKDVGAGGKFDIFLDSALWFPRSDENVEKCIKKV